MIATLNMFMAFKSKELIVVSHVPVLSPSTGEHPGHWCEDMHCSTQAQVSIFI